MNTMAEAVVNAGMPPLAVMQGNPITDTPKDLYIPPDALRVFLESFEGPLDLLLYFIKRHDFDILNISIAKVTTQYMEYIELMNEMKLELAGDYLVMAALLAEIKARSLLPKHDDESEEDDPRAELIRRLQEYERFRKTADEIEELPRVDRDILVAHAAVPNLPVERPKAELSIEQLVNALNAVLQRAQQFAQHRIEMESFSVRERMITVLERLGCRQLIEFKDLFDIEEGRQGVIVTFLAILELIKESLIQFNQSQPFSPIHVKLINHE